jgi:hypothetical protein
MTLKPLQINQIMSLRILLVFSLVTSSLLGESLLEEASGNSTSAWEEASNENTDWGKRRHIYAKGTVRTASSIFLSGKLVLKLPEIAEDLILKMGRAKGRLKFKDVADATDALQENLDQLLDKIKSLPDEGKKFLDDFAEAETDVLELFLLNPELVDSLGVLENNPILRKKPENLESISKWLDEGIEPQKLTEGIYKSRSKQNLIDELGTAKSKLHAQVLIKDYDNIPGVAKGRYTPKGLLCQLKLICLLAG